MHNLRFWMGSLFFMVLLSFWLGPEESTTERITRPVRSLASVTNAGMNNDFDEVFDRYRELPTTELQAAELAGKVTSRFSATGKSAAGITEKCDCELPGEVKGQITYESYDSPQCKDVKEATITVKENGLKAEKRVSGNRNYLQAAMAQVPDNYRLKRENPPEAQFPQACLSYIMKDFLSFMKDKTEDVPHGIFVTCSAETGTPVRGALKPCVTVDYVSSVYNSVIDVADCLEIPQKDLIPKIYNESGFHGAAFGGGDDTGVGQLTGSAIDDIIGNLGNYKYRISKSEKASCQRLKAVPGIFNEVPRDLSRRCELVQPPANPMRNVLYSGILYKQNRTYVLGAMKKHEIDRLMAEAGMANFNRDELVRMMSSLGYNAGPVSAVIYLKRYLLESIDAIKAGKRQPLKTADFDFRKGFEQMDKAKQWGKDPKELPISNLSLPEYLRIHSQTGAPGYLTFLERMHRKLSNAFGEGTCSPAGYLVM